MSYIRSGSNPEGLYIYNDVGGYIQVYPGSCDGFRITRNEFWRVCKAYKRYGGYGTTVKWKDLKITETDDYKIKLTYGKHEIIMWDVTWEYIVNNVCNRYT